MKYHPNTVQIIGRGFELYKENESYGDFVIKDFYVTDGQDPDGNIKIGDTYHLNKDGEMTFYVGRKKDSDTADFWKKYIKPECNTLNKNPDELNFAILGTLTLNVSSNTYGKHRIVYEDICIAQGHNIQNNWWFGGKKDCYYHSTYTDDYSTTIDSSVLCFGKCSEIVDGSQKKIIAKTVVERNELGSPANTYIFHLESIDVLINADWMSKLDNKTCLKNIMMPGSHDAGMSEIHHADVAASTNLQAVITQKYSIYEQLMCGCRYFDIRVDYDHDELVSYHRTSFCGANGQRISDILLQTSDFLATYKTEFVILKMSQFRDYLDHDPGETAEKLIEMIEKNPYVFKGDGNTNYQLHDMKKEDLAGKILIVFADEGCMAEIGFDSSRGVFKYHDVEIEVPETIPANQMNVFDKFANKSVYEDMKKDQLEKWEKNAGYYNTKLFLLSWTMTLQGIENLTGSIEILAKEANGKLESELEKARNDTDVQYKMPNIVYIDFVDSALCDVIIKQSFENWKK